MNLNHRVARGPLPELCVRPGRGPWQPLCRLLVDLCPRTRTIAVRDRPAMSRAA